MNPHQSTPHHSLYSLAAVRELRAGTQRGEVVYARVKPQNGKHGTGLAHHLLNTGDLCPLARLEAGS